MKSAFQPIVCSSGQRFGYEALLRVFDKRGTQIRTEPFLTSCIMSDSDRINLDRLARVIHLRNFARFLSVGSLFLNMAPIAALDAHSQVLTQHSLIPRVNELGLSIDQVYFEILEHHCSSDQMLINSLQNMQYHGIRIAIDDYGIDGSSETRARQVNPDIIKVDRSLLVEYIDGKPDSLHDAIKLARELNAKILVEGVEDERCYQAAKRLDVDYMQGYYIGHPELVHDLTYQQEPA
ncbi:EAL domain-containing protein [Photobacterium sp. SDRW27]|uniref:EAL domain-containing protein n=1 Tax=Photobacterium obscurum TaxID=2829490 RepID=UPI00224411A1|nr:EAL domain-containing protein [Photobacterium obscurum]MCW8328621.1 EAL domain-containing protein [Photobacterium obscurum]